MWITFQKINSLFVFLIPSVVYICTLNRYKMNIQDKMSIEAAEIKEAILRGEVVSPADRKFLKSFIAINAPNAGNAGKRTVKKHNKNW